jgi:hypothetical protein
MSSGTPIQGSQRDFTLLLVTRIAHRVEAAIKGWRPEVTPQFRLSKLLHWQPFSSNYPNMQISKSLLLGFAAVLCIVPQSIRAADTDAQVKAREALRNKMNELQGQPANLETTAPAQPAPSQPVTQAPAPQEKNVPKKTPPPVAAKKPKPATKPAPVTREAPPQSMPEVVASPPVDSEITAREREAVRKKMDELVAQPTSEKAKPMPPAMAAKPKPVATPKPAPPPVAAPSAAPSATPPVATRPAPTRPVRPTPTPPFEEPPTAAPAATPSTPAPVATRPVPTSPARPAPTPQFEELPTTATQSSSTVAAANERLQAERAAQAEAAAKPRAEKKQKKARKPSQGFQPMQGPGANISMAKQQQLNDLLRRYQADEVTPAQYHQERAKILAEP